MKLPVIVLADSSIPELPPNPKFEWKRYSSIDEESLNRTLASIRPVMTISVGSLDPWKHLYNMPLSFRKYWTHYDNVTALTDTDRLLNAYVTNAVDHPLAKSHPLISIITTTFKSGDKFLRPLKSLKWQTYDNWEWIIWDDSPTEEEDTYQMALKCAEEDPRIRVFRAPRHSGFIGEMKQLSSGLARGAWIVELDHDDIIVPDLLQWLVAIHNKYPNAEFVYSDFVELYEGTEQPFAYPEGYAFGFGSYARQRIKSSSDAPASFYQFVSQTPPLNPVTLSYIVGVPNHVRIWKRSFYDKIGKHNHMLPVVDDYELLLRSFFASEHTVNTNTVENARWIRIVAPAYFQYRNTGGNNFTFLRNALIQDLTKQVASLYNRKRSEKCLDVGWSKNEAVQRYPRSWEHPEEYPPVEHCFVPEDQEPKNPCVSVIYTTFDDEAGIRDAISTMFKQTYQNWILFIIGDACPVIDKVMEQYDDSRLRYFNLSTYNGVESGIPREYALRMLVRTRLSIFYEDGDCWNKTYVERFSQSRL